MTEHDPSESATLAKDPRVPKPGTIAAAHHDPTLPPIGEHRARGSHVGLLDVEEEVDRIVLGEDDETAGELLPPKTFSKLLWALATFALLLGLSYAIPLPWAQPWRADEDYVPFWNLIGRELMGQGTEAEAEAEEAARLAELAAEAEDSEPIGPVEDREIVEPPRAEDSLRYPEYATHELDPELDGIEQRLEDPEALAPFYAALTRTELGWAGAQTRVGHWGDSLIGTDGIPSAIRRRMQARFGDAGHGFHALKQYDASYRHQGVVFEELGGVRWQSCFIRNRCLPPGEGRYGYGGVVVWSAGGPTSAFATAERGSFGRRVGVIELWYQRRYKGGKIRLRVDGGQSHQQIIDTALPLPAGVDELPPDQRPAPVDSWVRVVVPDGPHRVEVRAAGDGQARAYGLVLERELPGVVWDGMALIGAYTKRLDEFEGSHLAGQLDHRGLDLMVFSFGGNDLNRGDLRRTMAPYIADYRAVIRKFRDARPEAACLIMGPVDHGERVGGRVVSNPTVVRMTEAQREVARAEGCAFFDTLAAMGGPGSISRWKSRGLTSPDLAHPSPGGHKLLGTWIYEALMAGYIEFRRERAGEPMASADPP